MLKRYVDIFQLNLVKKPTNKRRNQYFFIELIKRKINYFTKVKQEGKGMGKVIGCSVILQDDFNNVLIIQKGKKREMYSQFN